MRRSHLLAGGIVLAAWSFAAGCRTAPRPVPLAATAATNPIPQTATRQVRQYTLEQLSHTLNWSGSSFSPDGTKILMRGNPSGVQNVYVLKLADGEAMAPIPLTHSTTDPIFSLGYFPHDERFLYSSQHGGNEISHLYVQSPDGSVRDLTPGEKVKAFFESWARDDRSFFIRTNERDPRYFDTYEIQADGYARTLLYRNETGLSMAGISPDRRHLAFQKSGDSTEDSDIYLYDVASRKMENITRHDEKEGDVANEAMDWSPDGKYFYYKTDRGSEFGYLVRYELATGKVEEVLRPSWDIYAAYFSRNGRYLIVTINDDGRTELEVFSYPEMKPTKLPTLPEGAIAGVHFSDDNRYLVFSTFNGRSPGDIYLQDLRTGDYRRLTRSLDPSVDPGDLVAGKIVRFKSYDGVEIPGILYTPPQARPGERLPAVVSVHGGPGEQSQIGYKPMIQYLVNHGYVVYEINNRGSSGYGKTFYAMDDRKHGEADLDDCVASKKMLIGLGYVDPDRIGIMGGSYGGYLVLAALAFRPREFAVGVDEFGISNWLRVLTSMPAWWEAEKKALYKEMGDPVTDAEYLKRISPLFHTEAIERPLLVLQGKNDPRIPQAESDEIVAAVKARGVPVEYVVFPDEGHGFMNRANAVRSEQTIADFLDRYLKGGSKAKG